VGVPKEISVVTCFLTTPHNIYGCICVLNPHTHHLNKGKNGKLTGSQRCPSCSPCSFPTARQEGGWDKPFLCSETCNLGKVERRDGS